MAQGEPSPRQMLAVLFGASSFRRAPNLAQGRAFYDSAQDFREYLTGVSGLGLPCENVDWLFDDTRSPSDQLQDIREFLESRSTALKNEGFNPQDLIVYYVGHGLFSGADYCLAVRSTDERSEGTTSIRVSDLASIIKNSARFLRKFLILDCCFSAAAYREFQSSPLTTTRVKVLQELPQKGTALLCSASAQDASLAPVGRSRTMFSGSLLSVLHHGHGSLGPRLSLSELGDLVKVHIHETYRDTGVRPQVHSPDQREGDVADIPLFPNASYLPQKARKEQQKAKAAATEQERIAREKAEAEPRERERAEATERKVQPLGPLTGHTNSVESVAFSPDGKTLASASWDNTIRLWDVASRQALGTPLDWWSKVSSVAFSPDGKTLASASRDNTVRLWDVASRSERR